MRATSTFVLLVALHVSAVLATPADGMAEPTPHKPAPVALSPAMGPRERVEAMLRANVPRHDPARVAWIIVPAGESLVGSRTGGAWSLSTAQGALEPIRTHDAAECDNDAPAEVVPAENVDIPTYFWLADNPTWPATRNDATLGACPTAYDPRGGVSFFQFQTVGDYGGQLHLEGSDARQSARGTYDVGCFPAGSDVGVGAEGQWPNLIQFQNATCGAEEEGLTPDQYETWGGWVANYNSQPGMSTYGLAR